MMQYVIIECDNYGDIIDVFGNFHDMQAGMKWLRDVHVPAWIKDYETESGFKTDVRFYGNGAADGTTCTRWLCRTISDPKESYEKNF
jgi:hypothetical protein